MAVGTIGVRELETYAGKPDTRLVDLRAREEYDQYHLEGAVNLPYEDLEKYKGRLSKNLTYIFYCERGVSSLLAAKELSREGYRVYTLVGGIHAFEQSAAGKE